MGVPFVMDVNFSVGYSVSAPGRQADAMGFHSHNGPPFDCNLLLERRPVRSAMEQRGWQLMDPFRSLATGSFAASASAIGGVKQAAPVDPMN